MRDNFSQKTKTVLASRVAYRCSFPGCNRLTIGPGSKNSEDFISIGEAAHICSAAPNGPRNNPHLTSEERSAVSNGIWMCKSHARLIDADEINYSAETLLKWKIDQENFVRKSLENLEQEVLPEPLTFVMLNIRLILECRWIYVEDQIWKFKIYNFIEGNLIELREYLSKYLILPEWERYIVVESQGDGRVIESLTLATEQDNHILSCKLHTKLPRTNPHEVGGDFAMADDGDLTIVDGDFGIVKGVDCALQIIRTNLSWKFGWWANPLLGSYFTEIYKKYNHSEQLLDRVIKLEVVRLITVPTPKGLFDDSTEAPELSFVNRINWVHVSNYNISEPFLPIQISLEWGNNETWEGQLKIPFSLNESNEA